VKCGASSHAKSPDVAVLDTHAAIWYLLDTDNLSPATFSLIDTAAAAGTPMYISAGSLVEVVHLVERGRIVPDAFDRFVRELRREYPAFQVVPVDYNIVERVAARSARCCSGYV
jgi:PIN domain nuclease of toxin-antitoxin system